MLCRDCTHFDFISHESNDKTFVKANIGICKRFPPEYVGSFSNDLPTFMFNDSTRWRQPVVNFNDSCGEWHNRLSPR